MAFVYWIHKAQDTDFTASGYIGVTSKSVQGRYKEHKYLAGKGGEYALHKAIRKHSDDLVVDTLLEGSEEYCYDIEFKLRPTSGIGYNCAVGGVVPGMLGMRHNDNTKAKISKAFSGSNHPLFGKNHTAETREKISASQRGSKGNQYGKKLTPETKQKMAEWIKNNPHPFSGLMSWELPRANKSVWSKAVEVSQFMLLTGAGVRNTAKAFGGTDSAYQKLFDKIKSGWNPNEDLKYLAWLEQNKECYGT